MPSRYCIQYVSQSGRPSSGHRTRKGQSSSQFSRRIVKNMLTMRQLHSSPMLVSSYLKSCILGFSIMWTRNFQRSKLGLKKEEETDQIANTQWIIEKAKEFQKPSTSVSLTMPKPLTVWIIINCGKLLKKWKYQTILPVSWETCMRFKKQQLEPCMEQLVGSRLRSMTGLSAVTLSV